MFEINRLQNEIFGPVSLSLQPGNSLVVGGASGAGKTRFLRAIADLDPAQGTIFLDGKERAAMPAYEWRQKVRYVPATSDWWHERVAPHFHNVRYLPKWMDALGLPEKLLEWQVSDLSTGEKQRLAFLRAIQDKPAVLLLDEPTSALDGTSIERMELMIDAQIKRGAILMMASHSPEQIKKYGEVQLTFEQGKATLSPLPKQDQHGASQKHAEQS